MKIILGSSSPRRKIILENYFDNLIIIKPEIDETVRNEETTEGFCLRMSVEKNEAVDFSNISDCYIITSDTIVAYNNMILQKPKDYNEAFDTLMELRNNEHFVISSICISKIQNHEIITSISDIEKTKVIFKNYSDDVIKRYLELTDYSDKAGSYAIQENGELIVEKYIGSYTNIVGFPLRLFFKMLFENNWMKIFN